MKQTHDGERIIYSFRYAAIESATTASAASGVHYSSDRLTLAVGEELIGAAE